MRKVQLVNGIYSSALGFGCAPICGSVDSRTARRALDLAIDRGVTHLDLARSYGYGEAEQFIGKAIKGKRDQLVLATKFGIVANWKAGLLKPLKPLVRILRNSSSKGKAVHSKAQVAPVGIPDRFHDRIPLRSANMQKSLEASLKALGTDYVDFFFIHEPSTRVDHIEELKGTAELLKKQGKIRAWGLAYMRSKEEVQIGRAHV